jgi:GntR family transcriptional regulator/MocR family aminotransferase
MMPRSALDQLVLEKVGHFVTVDLHLDFASAPSGGRRVEHALREAIVSGRLSPGDRMPSTRALAQDVGVARNTVLDAYEQLVAEGYLTSRPGSGTFVSTAEELGLVGHLRSAQPRASAKAFDLRPGARVLSKFPRAAWLRATRNVLDRTPDAAFNDSDPRGTHVLRESIAGYLARARGVMTDPDHIVICRSYRQSIILLGGALSQVTDTIAVEDPGLASSELYWNRTGLSVEAIAVDDDGMQVAQLWETRAGAALFTPRFHYPTGAVLSDDRRKEAVKWARETNGYLVEHEFDGELRVDTKSLSTFRSLDPDRIIYSESVSNSLTPGVRVGWIVMPDALLDHAIAAKEALDLQSSAIEQFIFADLINSNEFDRQVRKTRREYAMRATRIADLGGLPGGAAFSPTRVEGLTRVIRLPAGVDEAQFVRSCADAGLMVHPLDAYQKSTHSPGVVVGFGTPGPTEFESCIALLLDMLGSLTGGGLR